MKRRIYVDGHEGTTGLEIHKHLERRGDIELAVIGADKRKDAAERAKFLNEADIAFLCLPDGAAREAVSMIKNKKTRVIDASTAHRTADGWVYGIPELTVTREEEIAKADRVSVPGCFPTGFVMLVHPLVKEGVMQSDYPVCCHALTGYSGGGRSRIEEVESDPSILKTPCFYALPLEHKHIPEMRKHSGLQFAPVFTPIIAGYYRGMVVAVPIHTRLLQKKMIAADLRDFFAEYYAGKETVMVHPNKTEESFRNGFLGAESEMCEGRPNIEIMVFGGEDRALAVARLDNLGKGASAAAVQCMDIMIKDH